VAATSSIGGHHAPPAPRRRCCLLRRASCSAVPSAQCRRFRTCVGGVPPCHRSRRARARHASKPRVWFRSGCCCGVACGFSVADDDDEAEAPNKRRTAAITSKKCPPVFNTHLCILVSRVRGDAAGWGAASQARRRDLHLPPLTQAASYDVASDICDGSTPRTTAAGGSLSARSAGF